MKNILQYLSIMILLINYINAYSQKKIDTTAAFLTTKNEMVYTCDEVLMSAQYILYTDVKNCNKTLHPKSREQSEIKWLRTGNEVWLRYPIKENGKTYRLMQVVAMTNKYMLMAYWQDWYYLYIFDYNDNIILEKLKVFDRGKTIGSDKNNKEALDALKPYFDNCPELIQKLQKNFDEEKILISDLSHFECEGAHDLDEIILSFKNKYTEK